ncbi:hypothetical protein N431DRAFT_380251 [Stipitochalara longipes BDJ]|nr:hypothetical protein N431DRAFT_380251 [Stipitochalara longipes BDJ]
MDPGVSGGDRGPMLVGVSWLLAFTSSVFLSLRIYCKFKRKRTLWWDDYILIFAWLCLLTDTCLLTVTTSLGFGKHFLAINPSNLPRMGLLGIIAGVLAIFAAIYSKTSFAITLLRISEGRTRILLWFIIISVNIALGGSALIPWIQCRPVEKNWNLMAPGKCWNLKIFSYYGMASSAFSGAMDILLAFIPWKMVWNLQMKEKVGVATAMSMGVFAGAAAITKSVYNPLVASGDFSYDGANLVLWGQVESAICIIAVSIPVLRVLILEHVHSQQRETGETMGQSEPRTYATDTTSARPPSFVFPKEESNTTSTTTSERVMNWRDGSHEALP